MIGERPSGGRGFGSGAAGAVASSRQGQDQVLIGMCLEVIYGRTKIV